MVPQEGLEPPLLSESDFESDASTSSATEAQCHATQAWESVGDNTEDFQLVNKKMQQTTKNCGNTNRRWGGYTRQKYS